MIEMAMVFTREGKMLYLQPGSSAGSVSDSRRLWDEIWENREIVGGVAHTHPWVGPTQPSDMDVTTFKAVEAGLGKRLLWPIITFTHVNYFYYFSGCYEQTLEVDFRDESHWHRLINTLRFLSQQGENR
jgi:hypothetical protein